MATLTQNDVGIWGLPRRGSSAPTLFHSRSTAGCWIPRSSWPQPHLPAPPSSASLPSSYSPDSGRGSPGSYLAHDVTRCTAPVKQRIHPVSCTSLSTGGVARLQERNHSSPWVPYRGKEEQHKKPGKSHMMRVFVKYPICKTLRWRVLLKTQNPETIKEQIDIF